jgi:uncharacterized CHY-type Zn-finger protein
MIDKEERILRKYLDNDQMVILMQNDLLHLIAMSMRMYKNEDTLVKNLALSDVSKSVVCGNCEEIPKDSFYLGMSCDQCNRPFRVVKNKQ